MRKWLTGIWIATLLSGIACLFWHEDLKYSLPTPVPENYHPVSFGSPVHLNNTMQHGGRPLFLHFFNPKCPCSRFNIPHFRSLVRKYSGSVDFAVVVMTADKEYSAEAVRKKLDVDIPVYFDQAIADSCGVYSTPQAVLISSDKKLYFRGNYNKSRYCADKNTNFAQMAIDSMLSRQPAITASEAALKSYGCSLPQCSLQ